MTTNQSTTYANEGQATPLQMWQDLLYKQVPEYAAPDSEDLAEMFDLYPAASMMVLYKDPGVYGYIQSKYILCAVLASQCYKGTQVYLLASPERPVNEWITAANISAVMWRAQ